MKSLEEKLVYQKVDYTLEVILRESIGNIKKTWDIFLMFKFQPLKFQICLIKLILSFAVEETQTGAISFSVSHSNNYGISFGAGIKKKIFLDLEIH